MLNSIALQGNLTRDAQLLSFEKTGKTLLTFRIANNTGKKDDDKNTIFKTCNLWGERGVNLVQYLKKGKQVAVSGRLQKNFWNDKETGEERFEEQINVVDLSFCGRKDENEAFTQQSASTPAVPAPSYAPDPTPAPAAKAKPAAATKAPAKQAAPVATAAATEADPTYDDIPF